MVYGRIVIGGDVACAEVDGFMHGFAPDSARYGETAVNNTGSRQNEASASSAPAVESAPAESAPAADQGAASAVEPVQESGVESTGGELLPEEAYPAD